jgi:hypothetical protein
MLPTNYPNFKYVTFPNHSWRTNAVILGKRYDLFDYDTMNIFNLSTLFTAIGYFDLRFPEIICAGINFLKSPCTQEFIEKLWIMIDTQCSLIDEEQALSVFNSFPNIAYTCQQHTSWIVPRVIKDYIHRYKDLDNEAILVHVLQSMIKAHLLDDHCIFNYDGHQYALFDCVNKIISKNTK